MSLVDNTNAAVAALFLRRELDGPWLQVLLRERPEVAHPVTRKAVRRPPAAILTQGSRPVAVLIGELLVVSRTAARCVRVPLVREARSQGLDCVQARDSQLVKLASDYAVSAADAALGAQCASASGGLSRR
jgi:hypothetical protein